MYEDERVKKIKTIKPNEVIEIQLNSPVLNEEFTSDGFKNSIKIVLFYENLKTKIIGQDIIGSRGNIKILDEYKEEFFSREVDLRFDPPLNFENTRKLNDKAYFIDGRSPEFLVLKKKILIGEKLTAVFEPEAILLEDNTIIK